MNTTLPTELWQMPSIERFLVGTQNDLTHGRCTVLVVPAMVDQDIIWRYIRMQLRQQEYDSDVVNLSQLPHNQPLVNTVADALHLEWPAIGTARTVENLRKSMKLPEIIYLENFNSLPPDRQQSWWELFMAWARTGQASAQMKTVYSALFVMISADVLPQHQTLDPARVSVRWWWGIPTQLEMQVLCRFHHNRNDWDPRARWRESVLPALAGSDIQLIDDLWESIDATPETLLAHLVSYADRQQWHQAFLTDEILRMILQPRSDELQGMAVMPPRALVTLWSKGMVGWTPESGLELHTAVLAMLGMSDQVYHRIWRGQIKLLLPLIDGLRLTLCDMFTQRYGTQWPLRWGKPDSRDEEAALQETPLACQWGFLGYLVRKAPHLHNERHLATLVSSAHWVRNEIAHYRPVTFAHFDGLIREASEMGISVL